MGADLINITMGHNCMAEFRHVGGKVLPVCDASAPSSAQTDHGKNRSKKSNFGNECPHKNNSHKEGEKRRALSKMKELIRWAASSNPDKGGSKRWKVLYFRNRGALRGRCDDELASDSSKMSFKFDVGSRSASSACSPISVRSERMITRHSSLPPAKVSISACSVDECMVMKRENWITTDSDFVVLEL
ncbi:uncharacterized protein LOC116266389 [Nymphaea colorata]|nr:uncharacterized protein LOC116266389 [Nymphaea colorata]